MNNTLKYTVVAAIVIVAAAFGIQSFISKSAIQNVDVSTLAPAAGEASPDQVNGVMEPAADAGAPVGDSAMTPAEEAAPAADSAMESAAPAPEGAMVGGAEGAQAPDQQPAPTEGDASAMPDHEMAAPAAEEGKMEEGAPTEK